MRKESLFLILIFVLMFSSVGCSNSVKPLTAKDGSTISMQEQEAIGIIAELFAAMNERDVVKIKALDPTARPFTDEHIRQELGNLKRYVLYGVENATLTDGKIKALVIYSIESFRMGASGSNLIYLQTEAEFSKENGRWIMASWNVQQGGDAVAYFKDTWNKIEKAKKRYGVKNLLTWDELPGGAIKPKKILPKNYLNISETLVFAQKEYHLFTSWYDNFNLYQVYLPTENADGPSRDIITIQLTNNTLPLIDTVELRGAMISERKKTGVDPVANYAITKRPDDKSALIDFTVYFKNMNCVKWSGQHFQYLDGDSSSKISVMFSHERLDYGYGENLPLDLLHNLKEYRKKNIDELIKSFPKVQIRQ